MRHVLVFHVSHVLSPTLPGIPTRTWQVTTRSAPAVLGLARDHYSRQHPDSNRIGGPGRHLVLITPCGRALWDTHYTTYPDDGLNAWRCSIFRNEGAGLSSELILAAMAMTVEMWGSPPPDGWVTWVDPGKVRPKRDPGRCFIRARWWRDAGYQHDRLIRLRAAS